jgi:hypothetical protein
VGGHCNASPSSAALAWLLAQTILAPIENDTSQISSAPHFSIGNYVKYICQLSSLEIKLMWTVIAGFHIPQMQYLMPATGNDGVSIGFFIEHMENAEAFGTASIRVTMFTLHSFRHQR